MGRLTQHVWGVGEGAAAHGSDDALPEEKQGMQDHNGAPYGDSLTPSRCSSQNSSVKASSAAAFFGSSAERERERQLQQPLLLSEASDTSSSSSWNGAQDDRLASAAAGARAGAAGPRRTIGSRWRRAGRCPGSHHAFRRIPITLSPKTSAVLLATLLGTTALACHFHTFSTLFVYLSWLVVGLPLSLSLELLYLDRSSPAAPLGLLNSEAHLATKKRHTLSARRLIHYAMCASGIYIWLWTAAFWVHRHYLSAEEPALSPAILPLLASSLSASTGEMGLSAHDEGPVFIAANLYNSAHLFPRFSDTLVQLIDMLGGPSSAFVSIYESNSIDEGATARALHDLEQRLAAQGTPNRIVAGIFTNTTAATTTEQAGATRTTPASVPASAASSGHIGIDGNAYRRIKMLASVRNEALKPLDEGTHSVRGKAFRRVLWLNE